MSWNYRAVKHDGKDGEDYYQVHEIYYDEEGNPNGITQHEVTPYGASKAELIWCLEQMLIAARDLPTLSFDELSKGTKARLVHFKRKRPKK
jgi:hypothetical protein